MITKEQWEEIESRIKNYFFDAEFKLGDTRITVIREFIRENKLAYVVYLDGAVSFSYSDEKHEF